MIGFAQPEFLWLLTLLAPLLLWIAWGRWRRRKRWHSLAQRGRPSPDGTPAIVLSITCLIVALAQPRWGNLPAGSAAKGHDLVLVVDASRSMAAEDAVPNRMAMAIEVARSLVKTLGQEPSNRAAVVAFAGRGLLRCPLTENLGAVLDTLDRLQPGSVTPGGTDLGAALDAALEAMAVDPQEHAAGRAIVVFSDGEDHADRWRSRLDRLRQEDIVVHAVSIGDGKEGHPVPTGKSAEPLMFEGKKVLSMRSDVALEAIAHATGGTIVKLGLSSADLGTLYESKIEPLARRQHLSARIAGKADRFPLFLLTAFVLLILGCLPNKRSWHWRLSWLRGIPSSRQLRRLRPASVLILAVFATGAANHAPQPPGESAQAVVAQAKLLYDSGQLQAALDLFDQAAKLAPRSAVARYNVAATLYQLKRFGEARQGYEEARLLAEGVLRMKIDYALGNTSLALGEVGAAIKSYDDCLASTAAGATVAQVREDAEINRRFAVEQSQAPTIGDSDNPDGQSPKTRQDGRRGPNPRPNGDDDSSDGSGISEASGGGANPEGDQQNDPNRPPTRRRRLGGAGRTGQGSQGTPGDSPEDRLDAALEHIREAAESRRLPEEVQDESPAHGKDW